MKRLILLIDDDKEEFELFIEALFEEQYAYDCIFAQTADQALNLLCYTVPDFIFINYDMLAKYGFKCLSRIKSLVEFNNTPIILYSSNLTDELSEIGICNGATLCIKKRDRMYTLTRLLNKVMTYQWRN